MYSKEQQEILDIGIEDMKEKFEYLLKNKKTMLFSLEGTEYYDGYKERLERLEEALGKITDVNVKKHKKWVVKPVKIKKEGTV